VRGLCVAQRSNLHKQSVTNFFFNPLETVFSHPNFSPECERARQCSRNPPGQSVFKVGEDVMDMKLTHEEIIALQSLDFKRGPATARTREGDLPKKLFEFNLISRRPDGQALITKSGQQALFRHECVLALEAIVRGDAVSPGKAVEKWLVESGFVKPSDKAGGIAVLPRGRLWLDSLKPETTVIPASPTAESFAARRG
jgi:hypothetical protein